MTSRGCAIDIIAEDYVKAFALQLASFLLVVSSAAICQETKLGDSCDLSIVGATDTKSFLAFDKELRAAIAKQDAVALAFLVQFPLRINSEAGGYSLNNPAALQSRFQEAFPVTVRNLILNQKPEAISCMSEGVMYGNGEVWVNATKQGFAIQVVNLPSSPEHDVVKGPRKIDFICQTDKYQVVIDSDSKKSPRYRAWNKPHPVTGNPDLEIKSGTAAVEGTGGCSHRVWTFKIGAVTYTLEELGCFPDSNEPPKEARGMFEFVNSDKSKAGGWCY